MQRLSVWVLLSIAMLAAAVPLSAQPPRGGRGGYGGDVAFLLGQKSVQEELKLSDEQTKSATQFVEKQRESFAGLRELSREDREKKMQERSAENKKAVAEILKPDQLNRLKQISWQRQGAAAYSDPEVALALQLTDDQKDKIKSVQSESQAKMRELFQGGNRDEARGKLEELRKDSDAKISSVLTDQQKASWKELTGEPFKGEINFRGQGGGGRRRGNRA